MHNSDETDSASISEPVVKPTLNEVLDYADIQIGYYLRKKAGRAPFEQRSEAEQEARLKVLEHYETIEAERGWKAYVQRQCFGAIWDYFDRGRGFEERRKPDPESAFVMPSRAMPAEDQSLESIIDVEHFNDPLDNEDLGSINWDLLSRLCSLDHELHIFVRNVILGYSFTELASIFGVTRERLGQIVEEFIYKLSDPGRKHQWDLQQFIFALGLSGNFDMPATDNGYGWNAEPIDFSSTERVRLFESPSQLIFGEIG